MAKTWELFESILDNALIDSGYLIIPSKTMKFKNSMTGGRHKPDKIVSLVTSANKEVIIISKKWQAVNGTTGEKVFYEIIKLLDLYENYKQVKSVYILIGGAFFDGKLGDYYKSGAWNKYLSVKYKNKVKILDLNSILPLISAREL